MIQFVGKDAIPWDLVRRNESPFHIFVGGVTCPDECFAPDAADQTPESDFAMIRLTPSGSTYVLDTTFGSSGRREFNIEYTDVGRSFVFQQFDDELVPRIFIGGYSAPNDTSPYMAGARFTYDALLTEPVNVFRSNWGTETTGTRGDQIWQLGVQENLRVVGTGFHSRGAAGSNPTFGAMRLCKHPDEAPPDTMPDAPNCIDPPSPISGPGGGTSPQPLAYDSVRLVGFAKAEPSAPASFAQVIRRHEGPAPPEPERVSNLTDTVLETRRMLDGDEQPIIDVVFASVLDLPFKVVLEI